jgi:hypothetical protein
LSAADFDVDAAALAKLEKLVEDNPRILDILSESERVRAAVDTMGLLNRVYAKDCWRWLREQVWTIDEASQQSIRWPDKPYLHDMIRILDGEQMIVFPKSRRVMATWTVAAWILHRIRFFPNVHAFWQSETEDKASYVIQNRMVYIEDNLAPDQFRKKYTAIRTTKGVIGRVTFVNTKSSAWAVPQGADALRTFTPTILTMDESEFQGEGHAALVAALPFVEKGAKLVLLSSSNGPVGVIAGIAKELGFTSYRASA